MSYFVKDAYMFSFDLKSSYHHIHIAQEHQTFLGFHGGCLIPSTKYFMFLLCSRSVFPLPLMFSQGFEAFKKVLENRGTLYSHLLG